VLRIEVPARVADAWLARHPLATGLTYGFVIFRVIKPRTGASAPAAGRAIHDHGDLPVIFTGRSARS
jgi:hypothetical protein